MPGLGFGFDFSLFLGGSSGRFIGGLTLYDDIWTELNARGFLGDFHKAFTGEEGEIESELIA